MIRLSVMLVLIITLTSCNNSKSSGDNKVKNQNPLEGSTDINLEGMYESGCINDGGSSFSDAFEFENSTAEVTVTNFKSSDCEKGTEQEQYRSTYSFTFDGQLIEFTKGQYFYTYFEKNVGASYNSQNGFCEISDWQVDEEREITGKNCDGDSFITGEKFLIPVVKGNNNLTINDSTYRKI